MFYVVNEEKRTVVAYMENCDNDFINRARKAFPVLADIIDAGVIDLKMKRKYVGIAKCSTEDVFDEDYGKWLAEARALYRYWKDFTNTYAKLGLFVDKIGKISPDVFKGFMESMNRTGECADEVCAALEFSHTQDKEYDDDADMILVSGGREENGPEVDEDISTMDPDVLMSMLAQLFGWEPVDEGGKCLDAFINL